MTLNDRGYGFGHQIAYGKSIYHAAADFCRGNFDASRDNGHVETPMCRAIRAAGEHDELYERNKRLGFFPCREVGEAIFADEVVKSHVGLLSKEFTDGIHGEGRTFAMKLASIEFKVWLLGNCSGDHFGTSVTVGRWSIEFVRRDAGRKEDDFVESEAFACFAGKDEMPIVDGVEGSAVESD